MRSVARERPEPCLKWTMRTAHNAAISRVDSPTRAGDRHGRPKVIPVSQLHLQMETAV
jgi:hypothetical protein